MTVFCNISPKQETHGPHCWSEKHFLEINKPEQGYQCHGPRNFRTGWGRSQCQVEFLGSGVYFDALWFCSDNRYIIYCKHGMLTTIKIHAWIYKDKPNFNWLQKHFSNGQACTQCIYWSWVCFNLAKPLWLYTV